MGKSWAPKPCFEPIQREGREETFLLIVLGSHKHLCANSLILNPLPIQFYLVTSAGCWEISTEEERKTMWRIPWMRSEKNFSLSDQELDALLTAGSWCGSRWVSFAAWPSEACLGCSVFALLNAAAHSTASTKGWEPGKIALIFLDDSVGAKRVFWAGSSTILLGGREELLQHLSYFSNGFLQPQGLHVLWD